MDRRPVSCPLQAASRVCAAAKQSVESRVMLASPCRARLPVSCLPPRVVRAGPETFTSMCTRS